MEYFDNTIYNYIVSYRNDYITTIMKVITNTASAIIIIILAILFVIFIKDKNTKKHILLNLIFVFILNQSLKFIIARPRPSMEFPWLVGASGYSFPSGHSMVAFGFYGFLIYVLCNNVKNNKVRILISIFLGLLIFLIGISRIYLGVHYATDVLGGFLIALIYLFIFIKFMVNKEKKYESNQMDG